MFTFICGSNREVDLPNGMAINLTYTISETEFMQAARNLWRHEGIGERGNWIMAAIVAAIGAALLILGLTSGWIWAFASAMLIILTLLRAVLWRRAYRRAPKYKSPITATFEADTIQTTSADGNSTLSWDFFSKYAETSDHFHLYVKRRAISFIPKSALKTSDDVAQLRALFDANLARTKKRWL